MRFFLCFEFCPCPCGRAARPQRASRRTRVLRLLAPAGLLASVSVHSVLDSDFRLGFGVFTCHDSHITADRSTEIPFFVSHFAPVSCREGTVPSLHARPRTRLSTSRPASNAQRRNAGHRSQRSAAHRPSLMSHVSCRACGKYIRQTRHPPPTAAHTDHRAHIHARVA